MFCIVVATGVNQTYSHRSTYLAFKTAQDAAKGGVGFRFRGETPTDGPVLWLRCQLTHGSCSDLAEDERGGTSGLLPGHNLLPAYGERGSALGRKQPMYGSGCC